MNLIKENIEDELYVERHGNLLRFDPATEPMLPRIMHTITSRTIKNRCSLASESPGIGLGVADAFLPMTWAR